MVSLIRVVKSDLLPLLCCKHNELRFVDVEDAFKATVRPCVQAVLEDIWLVRYNLPCQWAIVDVGIGLSGTFHKSKVIVHERENGSSASHRFIVIIGPEWLQYHALTGNCRQIVMHKEDALEASR